MAFELIRKPDEPRPSPEEVLARPVPVQLHSLKATAEDYILTDGLRAAVNVALAVGSPLLVTGDPGTGKTQLAEFLAWYLQADGPFALHVKSTTVSKDLLYDFDTVGWFHESYATREGQGKPDPKHHRTEGPLWRAFQALAAGRPAVVLIDEIDKAPRDFPNDLLHELDQYSFMCPETKEGPIMRPKGAAPPVVVITSNSEKRLPEPFLRRCIFHHIEIDRGTVEAAVARRVERLALEAALQRAALDVFWKLRDVPGLRKPPSPAELMAWLVALHHDPAWDADELSRVPLSELPHLGALLKDRDDRGKL